MYLDNFEITISMW